MADIIDTLAAMDDAALSAKLGYDAKLADFRKVITDAAALRGDARAKIAATINQQLTPNIYPS